MTGDNVPGGLGSEQERERRLDALRQIASEQGGAMPTATRTHSSALPPAAGKRRPLRILGLVALVVCVVLAGAAALYVTHRAAPRVTASPIQRVIVSDGDLGCVFGAQYAPDGKTIAVLAGPVKGCNSTQGQGSYPTSLILYDTATMKPTQTIELENAILAKVKVPAGKGIVGGIGLRTNFLWSADSQRIAMFFAAGLGTPGSIAVTELWDGVAVVQAGTAAIQVISASSEPVYPSNGSISPSSYTPTWGWLINLGAGTMKPVRVPQALTYGWQPDDTVAVQAPVPASPDAAPAASSDGPLTPYGTTIDMWRGASVSEVSMPCAQPYFQVDMVEVVAWSPDGNAIFESGVTSTRLSTEAPPVPTPTPIPGAPTQPSQSCAPAVLAQLPTPDHLAFITPRDQGMPEALHLIKPDPSDPTQFGVSGLGFSWALDGKRVAVTPYGFSNDVTPYVAIYDSASGRQLAQYSIKNLDPLYKAGSGAALILGETWSPDGKTLLVDEDSTLAFIRV